MLEKIKYKFDQKLSFKNDYMKWKNKVQFCSREKTRFFSGQICAEGPYWQQK